MITRRLASALLGLALALAAPARAQSVAGSFVDADGTPIPSARVALQDESGRVVHAALTDASGRFTLRAPAAGRYVLRGERIGYASTVSEPLQLAAGEQASHRLVAIGQRVLLEAVVVAAESRCAPRPGTSAETAVVWGEVRKALDAVTATTGDQRARFTVELFERETQTASGTVSVDNRRRLEGMAHKPFVTVDPERLSASGFIERQGEGYTYAAPDADVLLSDRFLEEHCFRLRGDGAPAPGLIGLAFEPVRGRRVPDVQGVLWVDRASAELRLLEFEYTRPPLRGPRGVPGGRMEFLRLPDGRWITSSWVIRMPVESAAREVNALVPATRQVVAVREVGGAVQPPGTLAQAQAPAPAAGRVTVTLPAPAPAEPAAPAAVPTAEEVVEEVTAEVATIIEAHPAAPRAGDRRRFISRAEVERTTVPSAFELVQSLRPGWFRARGSDGMRLATVETPRGTMQVIQDESPIVVYLDGRHLGNLETLRSINHGDIQHVEYYDAVEAQQRFGVNNPQGAINVVTRRR
ncbi:MAG TPA: carboxypeptidase-like regulatory domain-containing protein [Longimicrobium sp.]|nr:carboxypeptidase-like regulatory domain-containing protein [Longimicrobium sp.]